MIPTTTNRKTTMTITPETVTRDQRSALLYVESCAVEYGGLLEGIRMNEADHKALTELSDAGFLTYGRIPGKMLGTFQRGVTHWCDLTETGWALAQQLRRARAAKPNASRQKVDAYFAERAAAQAPEVEAE
jgi:hypothetical protein